MKRTNNMADLFLLVQVIEAGSFSVAAENLRTTRSLLSRRIKTLERRLGVQLLHRNARRFSVTSVGEEIYLHASAMCESAMAAERAAADVDAGGRSLRIHVHNLLMPLMSSILPGFSSEHPQIRVWLTAGTGDFEPLIRQQADVVLSMSDSLPDSTDVVARTLTYIPMVVVGAPSLVMRLGPLPSAERIPNRDVLAYVGVGVPAGLLFRPEQRKEARMVTSDMALLLTSALAGLGFAHLPLYLCRDAILSGSLVEVPGGSDIPSVPIRALTMSSRAVSDAAVAFVRFVQKQLSVTDNN